MHYQHSITDESSSYLILISTLISNNPVMFSNLQDSLYMQHQQTHWMSPSLQALQIPIPLPLGTLSFCAAEQQVAAEQFPSLGWRTPQ